MTDPYRPWMVMVTHSGKRTVTEYFRGERTADRFLNDQRNDQGNTVRGFHWDNGNWVSWEGRVARPSRRSGRPFRPWQVEVRQPGRDIETGEFRSERTVWDYVDPWPWRKNTEVTIFRWRENGWIVYEELPERKS